VTEEKETQEPLNSIHPRRHQTIGFLSKLYLLIPEKIIIMSLLRGFIAQRTSAALRTATPHVQKSKQLTIFGLSTTLTLSHFYSTSTPLYTESQSKSSTVFREASPAAVRRPPTQLVFLSRFEERRNECVI
jgi:hypothetical protein